MWDNAGIPQKAHLPWEAQRNWVGPDCWKFLPLPVLVPGSRSNHEDGQRLCLSLPGGPWPDLQSNTLILALPHLLDLCPGLWQDAVGQGAWAPLGSGHFPHRSPHAACLAQPVSFNEVVGSEKLDFVAFGESQH
jgi:hypothetical protein